MSLPIPLDWWLCCGAPWVRFQARRLFGGGKAAGERVAVLAHPVVKSLLVECTTWPADSRSDHRSASDLLNKVAVLADFGVRKGDPGVDTFAERVLKHRDEHGRILNHVLMPRGEEPTWLYDVDGQDPLLSLVELGFAREKPVREAVEALIDSAEMQGGWVWPDARSPLPCRKFAGGCPYPTLKILRILSHDEAWATSNAAENGLELLLGVVARKEVRYGFGVGERFEKLKYPFIWFDVLHVLEATSLYARAWKDPRFVMLLDSVVHKADEHGRFTPESVWMEWKAQCFGQKKVPSPWLTLVIHRIVARNPARTSAR